MDWRVTSADGHPVSGSYEFTVGGSNTNEPQSTAPTTGAKAGEGAGEQTSDPAEPEPVAKQDTDVGSTHGLHAIGLGIGALVILALVLLRQR